MPVVVVVVIDDGDDDHPQVSLGSQQRKLSVPDDPRRFDSCVSILGKQSFTSGRHYWVVQVGRQTTNWTLTSNTVDSTSADTSLQTCAFY